MKTPTFFQPSVSLSGMLAAAITVLLCCQTSHAALTLYWQSEAFGVNFKSDGTTTWDSSYTAHVGVFDSFFTPTQSNTDDWQANWNEIGSAAYDPTNRFFSGQVVLSDGYNAAYTFTSGNTMTSIPTNTQIYIWVQDVGTPVGSQVFSQWLLAKDTNWLAPAESLDGSQANRALTLDLTSTQGGGVNVVFGGSSGGSPQQVGGNFTPPPTSTWNFQTHEVVTLIPEPSSSLLLAIGAAALLVRRSRKSNFTDL